MSHNNLTKIPPGIGYLQRLSKFNASDNQINELPEEIGDIFGKSMFIDYHYVSSFSFCY